MKHIDCKYYLAVDVFKGICKRTKDEIYADKEACDEFEILHTCKHCSNYRVKDEKMGLCMDKMPAYPDMNAALCRDFRLNN